MLLIKIQNYCMNKIGRKIDIVFNGNNQVDMNNEDYK